MTTLSSLSKILLALTFVTAGAVGIAEAAPQGRRALSKAKAAPSASQAERPMWAKQNNRRNMAQAVNRPMVVAQAPTPAASAGKITRKERRAERIAKFDSNNNGQIDASERLVMQEQRFAKLDANGDRVITLAEMQAAKKAHRKERLEKGEMHPGKKAKHRRAHLNKGQHKGKRGQARFAKLDSDSNGSVSWQEFSAAKGKGHGLGGQGQGLGGQGKSRGRY